MQWKLHVRFEERLFLVTLYNLLYLLYLVEDVSDISYIIKVVGNQWYWSYEFRDFKSIRTFRYIEDHWCLEIPISGGSMVPFYTNTSNFIAFDSVMLSESDLLEQNYGFRLLEVNNRLKLLYLVNTCFLVTSTDVLHSWSVPSLGVRYLIVMLGVRINSSVSEQKYCKPIDLSYVEKNKGV